MVDKRPIGAIAGQKDYLEKKVPKNPKYSSVSSSLNTGLHAKHIETVSDQTIAKRKGELFARVKPSTLATKLKQDNNIESIYNLVDINGEQGDFDMGPSDTQSVYSSYTTKTGVSDVSKMSSVTSAMDHLVLGDSSEFLLLDLREPEDFELFHIKEAINYPAPNLGRDKIIPELFKFKNKEGKLIIIYHLDERNGIPLANLLVQKGYDNVYLITGGVEAFLEHSPELVEGKKVPVVQKPEKKNKVLYKRTRHIGEPEEGNVVIPPQHLEDDSDKKSMVSSVTRTSNISSASRMNQSQANKTVTTSMAKSSTNRMPTSTIKK